MAIRNIYICDICGEETEEASDFKSVNIDLDGDEIEYNYFALLICKNCTDMTKYKNSKKQEIREFFIRVLKRGFQGEK